MNFDYATSSFDRARGDFPELPLVNLLPEKVGSEEKVALISRPGLEEGGVVMGTGPVTALFSADGVLGGNLYGVSNGGLYEASALIGSINGSGPASIAGYDTPIFINNGKTVYSYDGTTLTALPFPDGADVIKVVVGASRAIAIRKDSQKFYWTEPLDVVFDDLAYASAEYSPDNLKDAVFFGDTLVLFCTETTEFWPVSARDADTPFEPMQGRVFQVGVKETGAATLFGSSFAWVTDRNQICVGTPETVISYPGLEAQIEDADSVRLWTFRLEGSELLAVTIQTGAVSKTLAFKEGGAWVYMESFGEDHWLPRCYSSGVFGGATSGQCYTWSEMFQDVNTPLERRFRAWLPIDAGTVFLTNVLARVNGGRAAYGVDASIEMRLSRNSGESWGPWSARPLGLLAEYRAHPTWRSLGGFSYPGALAEFRVTSPVSFRVSNLTANEPVGGR